MADEDKNRPREWGHLKSPLFNKLPPEVRNKIYHETFAGSERDLVLYPPLDVRVVPITGRRSIFSTAKSTHNFLLTCFQVYSEALAIYWSLTVIGNLRDPSWDGGNNRYFTRGYFLNRIPAIARQHVQHLRDVGLLSSPINHWLHGDTIPRDVTFAESLDFFPNLKSCSFPRDSLFISRVRGQVAARHPHIHTLMTRYSIPPRNDPPVLPELDGDEYWILITFKDFTSGKTLSWYQPMSADRWISDEDAFQMVLNAPDVEMKAIQRRLDIKALTYSTSLEELLSSSCVVS